MLLYFRYFRIWPFDFTKAKTNTQTKRNNPSWKVYLFHIKLVYVLLHCPCSNPWLVYLYTCCFDPLSVDHVPTGYSAVVAMPQLFPLFLLINMYPSIPQSTPETNRHLFYFHLINVYIKWVMLPSVLSDIWYRDETIWSSILDWLILCCYETLEIIFTNIEKFLNFGERLGNTNWHLFH